MKENIKYMVSVSEDAATKAGIGKASYINCRCVGDFLTTVIEKGCRKIAVDCSQCTGMDSTFLGMVAGAAIRLRKLGGNLSLAGLNERNSELIENLGLGKIVAIIDAPSQAATSQAQLSATTATTEGILAAHENLVAADASNLSKFEDVITFLKKEME